MKKLLVLFLFTSAVITSQAQKVEFKLKLPLNQPYKSVTTMKMDMNGEQSVIMDMSMKGTITATKLESSNYTFENVTDAIKVDMDAGMMTINYDSENPSDDPTAAMMGAQFEKLIGKKLIMVTSDRGKLISAEGLEGMENAFDNLGITASYPDKAISPGETWPSEAASKGLKTKATNKYVAKVAEGYQVESIGDLLNESDTKVGTFTANYIVDTETFFTKSATIKMEMDIEGQKVTTDMLMTVTK